ncbi:MAG: arsenite methyltransferase [Ignavibacteria bacterium]|nr:arsenite methyltransferase [Ignavibacteria bacterium]
MKTEIRERYGSIAKTEGSCCGPTCCGQDDVAELETPGRPAYEGHDQDVVETTNQGLGCGDPVRFSGIEEGMTVLDLGAGGGIDVFLSAKQVGSTGRVIGLDMTDEMLERAETNRKKLGLWNTVFLKGEIENIPLPARSVDRVISNCVINLVPDKEKAFREIHRVLREGGAFVISDIVTDGTIPDLYREDPFLWSGCVAGAMDKAAYLETIQKAGFGDVRVLTEKRTSDPGTLPFSVYSVTVTGVRGEGL